MKKSLKKIISFGLILPILFLLAPTQVQAADYTEEYWNDATPASFPTGDADVSQTTSSIDYTWADGESPHASINVDNFIGRWTKTETFDAGNYDFSVTADDGVRVYIDDVAIIDEWNDQSPTTFDVIEHLTAGNHDVRVEFYESAGGAQIAFSYTRQTTIYANSETGDDVTGDGSSGAPYKTFTSAYADAIDGDIIDLTGTFTWTDTDETGDVVTDGFVVEKDLTIQGQRADETIIQGDTTPDTAEMRLFTLGSQTITLQNLSLRYGHLVVGSGSTLTSTGSLSLLDTYIYQNNNSANTEYNSEGTYMGDDRFNRGGVVITGTSGSFVIRNSTFAYNTNPYTSALSISQKPGEITNCTFIGNHATYQDLYIGSGAIVTMTNSTFLDNSSSEEILVWDSGTELYMKNNIIARSSPSSTGKLERNSATVYDGGNNLIENLTSINSSEGGGIANNFDPTTTNIIGEQGSGLNISTVLAANGAINGVPNLALLVDSPAIDTGDLVAHGPEGNEITPLSTDQRGKTRYNVTYDMGAVEYNGTTDIGPYLVSSSIDSDNAYIDIIISEGVYNTNGGNGALEDSDFEILFEQNTGGASGASITSVTNTSNEALSGGETEIRVNFSVTGSINGVETIKIQPTSSSSIYDADGNYLSGLEETDAVTLNGYFHYYVRADGDDANDGSADDSANAWLTIQHAIDTVTDPSTSPIKVHISGGTYTHGDTAIAIDRNFQDLVLQGAGAGVTIIQPHADPDSSAAGNFDIGTYEDVTINDMTIRYGRVDQGSGINKDLYGSITVTNVLLDDNDSTSTTGGFYTNSDLTMTNSTLSNSDTPSGTTRGHAGLIIGSSSTAVVTNSTFYNNRAGSQSAGNIYNRGNLTILNSTMIGGGSTSSYGNFMTENGSTTYIKNCIVANNDLSSYGFYKGTSATIYSGGYNIIETTNSTGSFSATGDVTGDQALLNITPSPSTNNNTNNGTKTLALLSGSIAIDACDSADYNGVSVPTTDQRGEARYNGTCDIGAFEYQGVDEADPYFESASLSSDNSYIDVAFDTGTYNTNGGSGALEVSDFSINFTQGVGLATDATISSLTKTTGSALSGGEVTVRVNLSIAGSPAGVETISIVPAGATSIYDAEGNPMPTVEETDEVTLNGYFHYYVRVDGDDANDGSADDSDNAWLTIQHAIDTVTDTSTSPITIHISGDTFTHGNTVIDIDRNFQDLVLQGAGAGSTIIQPHADPDSSLAGNFDIGTYEDVTINDMTIQNGRTSSTSGPGIYFSSGTLNINNCVIHDNDSSSGKAGIYIAGGTVNIENSTISDNNGGYAGGISSSGGTVTIRNSTLYGGTGTYGGNVTLGYQATFNLINNTIAGGGDGVATYNSSFTSLYMKNNLIIDADSGYSMDMNGAGYKIFGENNIIENQDSTYFTNGVDGNIVGTELTLNYDTLPADNGTTTGGYTYALLVDSVAINAGDDADYNGISVPTLDQRGFFRSGLTDIGAFEYGGFITVDEPITQVTNLVFSSVDYSQATLDFTAGDGDRRIVFMKEGVDDTEVPTDDITYAASSVFGNGTELGTGWYAVYKGSSESVTITGLTPNTGYVAQVFEYNGPSGFEDYLTGADTNNPNTTTTSDLTAPTSQVTTITLDPLSYITTTVNWSVGDGAQRVAFMKAGTGTATPVDTTTYTANATFGSGTELDTGWYAIYKGTGTTVDVTGLIPDTEYTVQVFEFNGPRDGYQLYLSGSNGTNPVSATTTDVTPPSSQATGLSFSVSYQQTDLEWVVGDGAKRVVFMKQASTGTAEPVDRTNYTASSTFTSGTQIDATGWYAVYDGTGTTVTVTGLTDNTDYIVQVFEYNEPVDTYETYLSTTSSENSVTDTTLEIAAPTTQVTSLSFDTIEDVQIEMTWVAGNGDKRIVFIKQASTGLASPADSTNYTASSTLGSGTQIDATGWYAVYDGTGTTVTVSGLTPELDYIVQVFEYNEPINNYERFLTSISGENSVTSPTIAVVAPTSQALDITFSSIDSTTMTVGWTSGDGERRVVFLKEASTGTATPVDETTYTANAAFESGTELDTGWYAIYDGTGTSVAVTGLTSETTYIAQAFEYNGPVGYEKHLTVEGDTDNPNTEETLGAPPGDGFETGDFTEHSWTHSGTADWEISTESPNGGTYCVENGNISDGQTSIFEVTVDVASPGNISFYKKTSTEGCCDKLKFYIDGSLKTQWGGSVAWANHIYAVETTGEHTFKWEYYKDGSVSSGSDTVWVDDIVFPQLVVTDAILTYTAGANGSITGDSPQTVAIDADGTAVTAVSDSEYRFVNWSDSSTDNPRTDTSVSGDISVTANFLPDSTFALSYTADIGGSITGSTSQEVLYGNDGSAVTAVPNTGYSFVNWSDSSTDNPRTDTSITDDLSLTANFTINTYDLAYSAGANGTLTGTVSQTVDYNTDGSAVTAVPDTGYSFVDWSDSSTDNPRTDTSVADDITVTANFTINTYDLTYTAGDNGSFTGSSSQTVDYNTDGSAITAVPDAEYRFVNWSDSSTDNPRMDTSVTDDVTVTANFLPDITYTLTYAVGDNGSITGDSPQSVLYGNDGTAVTAVPDSGYSFVNWSDETTSSSRTDTSITDDLSLTANFTLILPVLSAVVVSDITDSGAIITWTSDIQGSSRVQYGLTTALGGSASTTETNVDSRVTSHSATLSSLASCTTYYYRTKSTSSNTGQGMSNISSFSTTGCSGDSEVVEHEASDTAVDLVTGGTVELKDGNNKGVSLAIPDAYSDTEAFFQIMQLDDDTVIASTSSPSGYSPVSDLIFEFQALSDTNTEVTTFDSDLSITMSYLDADISSMVESSLQIFNWDGSSWTALTGCTVDASANTVTCATSHFSSYGLFGTPTPAPSVPAPVTVTPSGGGGGGAPSVSFHTVIREKQIEKVKENNLIKKIKDFVDLSDITSDDWQYLAIKTVLEKGLMEGYLVDKKRVFDMNRNLTRAEVAVFIAKYLNYDDKEIDVDLDFEDVPSDEWFASAVSFLKENGIIKGRTETHFYPYFTVTRAEFLKMAIKAYIVANPDIRLKWQSYMETPYMLFADITGEEWFVPYIYVAIHKGFLYGYVIDNLQYAMPNKSISKIECAALIMKLMNLSK